MINQQSAARSTSCRKQHKTICLLRTNTTGLFPVDRDKRPKQQRRQRHHSNSKASLPHCRYFSIEYSRGKEPPNGAIPGRMHATGFFRGNRLYCLLYDLCVAQLNNRNDFSPCFLLSKRYSLLFGTPSPLLYVRQSVCVMERISVCAYTRIYITFKSTNYVDVPELPHPRGRGRSHSSCCCVAFSGAVIVITTSSF